MRAQTPVLVSGTDAATGNAYTTVAVQGAPAPATMLGQCTRTPEGRTRFDLFLYFGGVPEVAYEAPWRRTLTFPNAPTQVFLKLDFLGYTRVKPIKLSFETISAPTVHYHFLPAGMHSANLADFPALTFPYLRALPTLRATDGLTTADFPTAGWMAALRSDPICAPLKL